MASRHFWIPEYECTLKPLMASRDIVRGLQTLHDIEFAQEAQDIFEDAFQIVIEECAEEREGAVEEVTDKLQEKIDEAKSEMEEMVAAHADQIHVLTSEHQEALEDLATAHRGEIARLQADYEAHVLLLPHVEPPGSA